MLPKNILHFDGVLEKKTSLQLRIIHTNMYSVQDVQELVYFLLRKAIV